MATDSGTRIDPRHCPEDEWRVRVDLAAAYRLAAMHGWDDLVYTHISASVPGVDGRYLINPFGQAFGEITASGLVEVDVDGRVIAPAGAEVNPSGFAIHGAVHAARPDARCVAHLHTRAGTAVSMLDCGLLPLSQHAMRFHRRIAYHDYGGLRFDADERVRLLRDLGPRKAMLLRNHGVLTCGATVAEAYVLMATLEKACTMQLAAMATGAALIQPPAEVVERTAELLDDADCPDGALEWPALLRSVRRAHPDFER